MRTKLLKEKINDHTIDHSGNTVTNIFTTSLLVSISSILNIALGFFLQTTLAILFGATNETDIYFAAMSIPNLLTNIFVSAINISLVPTLVKYQTTNQRLEAIKILRDFFVIISIFTIIISIILIVTAEPIIQLLFPGFSTENHQKTKDIFILLVPTIFFLAVGSILRSMYQAQQKFFVVAIAPLTQSLVMIISTWVLANHLGITAIAIATLLGSVAQLVITLPLIKQIYQLTFSFPFSLHPSVYHTLGIMVPWIISAVFYKSNNLIDRFVASQFDTGAISALGYAYRLMSSIQQILTQGISVVFFSIMSTYTASNNQQKLQFMINRGVKWTIILSFPSAVFMMVASDSIIRYIFEYGRFDALATTETSFMLRAYIGAFIAGSIGSILTYVFYAQQDTMTVAWIGIAGFVVNLTLALALTPYAAAAAPAFAFSFASIFNLFLLIVILHRRNLFNDHISMTQFVTKATIASLAAGLFWYSMNQAATHWNISFPFNILVLILNGLGGLFIFFGIGLILKANEFFEFYQHIRMKLFSRS